MQDLDLTTRALYAGIPLADLSHTTLLEIDLAYRAKELDRYAQARTLVELKLSDMSSRQLGKDDAAEEKDSESDIAAWEARGEQIKQEIREKLYYTFAPEHIRAMMDLAERVEVEPLDGVSPAIARTVMRLLEAGTFTQGSWGDSEFRAQLTTNSARERLEASADRGLP